MKILILALSLSMIGSASAGSQLNHLDSHERSLVRACEAVRDNNRLNLHRVMKKLHVNFRQLQQGLVCNGHDPATFAQLNQADKTAAIIARYNPTAPRSLIARQQ